MKFLKKNDIQKYVFNEPSRTIFLNTLIVRVILAKAKSINDDHDEAMKIVDMLLPDGLHMAFKGIHKYTC